ALQVEGKDVVTSSQTDHHGHAAVLVTSLPEDRERGVGDGRQQLHRLVTGVLDDDFLQTDGTGLSRCLVGPDIQRDGWLCRARRHRGGKPDEHRGEHQVRSHDSGSLRGYGGQHGKGKMANGGWQMTNGGWLEVLCPSVICHLPFAMLDTIIGSTVPYYVE